jgi:hypothetical protein
MQIKKLVCLALITMLLTPCGLSAAEAEKAAATVDGLQHVKDSNLAMVYVLPGVDFSQYQRVNLADAYIAFKKNWQRNQNRSAANRISTDDMLKIKAELAELFYDVFTKTLEEGGYELVTSKDDDVLLIKPAIINLDIVAPAAKSTGNTHTYSESAGEMTLYLELYDSVSGALIAKAMDRQKDRQTGYFKWQNKVANRAAANRILQAWADVLKEGLDEARATGPIQ